MRLVLFDIDNTLLRSAASADRSYRDVLCGIGGFAEISTDWSRYPHVTASSIAVALYETHRGRRPTAEELAALRDGFVEATRQVGETRPEDFAPLPGARAFLERLTADPGTAVALASGSWGAAQRLKLGWAGLGGFDVPEAYSDDADTREGIVAIARERACTHYGVERFDREVYVGDGVWDAIACKNLGLPLVGIGAGRGAERLQRVGVSPILTDFADAEAVWAALEDARVPTGAA